MILIVAIIFQYKAATQQAALDDMSKVPESGLVDHHDFVNPKPMGPPRKKKTLEKKERFMVLSENDIKYIQYQAKSDKTNKTTKWAVNQL